jgi:hypothetical protein
MANPSTVFCFKWLRLRLSFLNSQNITKSQKTIHVSKDGIRWYQTGQTVLLIWITLEIDRWLWNDVDLSVRSKLLRITSRKSLIAGYYNDSLLFLLRKCDSISWSSSFSIWKKLINGMLCWVNVILLSFIDDWYLLDTSTSFHGQHGQLNAHENSNNFQCLVAVIFSGRLNVDFHHLCFSCGLKSFRPGKVLYLDGRNWIWILISFFLLFLTVFDKMSHIRNQSHTEFPNLSPAFHLTKGIVNYMTFAFWHKIFTQYCGQWLIISATYVSLLSCSGKSNSMTTHISYNYNQRINYFHSDSNLWHLCYKWNITYSF